MKIVVPRGWRKGVTAVLALAVGILTGTCALTSARWMEGPFPGFFVMANRVIASVSLPYWPVAQQRNHLYQNVVAAVNNQPISTSAELYATVRSLPPGSLISYTVESNGESSTIILPSLLFTVKDYCLLFGAYLFTGLAMALIGIGVWFLKPGAPASQALLAVGLGAGVFALTGADLYSPHWFFRLHVLSEAFFPASLVHLALVFPVDRLRRFRTAWRALPYLVSLTLGVAYEWYLYQPAFYSVIHNLCGGVYLGAAGLVLLGKVVWDYSTTDSHLVRQRIRVIFLGFLSGFAFPAVLMFVSGISGGQVSVNYAAFTSFLFPLSLGYAIVKHDLFEIDALLKRGVYYLTLTTVLTLGYLAFLALLNLTLRSTEFFHSPLFPLLFVLTMALLLNPVKDYVQQGVDRIFFRLRYNPKKVLELVSGSLASTLRLEEILSLLWRTINDTVSVQHGGLFLLTREGKQYVRVYPEAPEACSLSREDPLIQELRQKGYALALSDLVEEPADPEGQPPERKGLEGLHVQLLIPFFFKGELIGLSALGPKESGVFFSSDDIDFLMTLANQGALSIANALSYQTIEELNTSLEQKVEERTEALAEANLELQISLQRLEVAYRDLQLSQENLLRAEKMAALGRMTAGIAHEMNTPLGASLTSLKLVRELVEEYAAAISDPEVNESDHQDIAAEMGKHVHDIQQWVEKAASYIRSLKLHTRDLQRGEARFFAVLQALEDTQLLLSHRLRLSQCTLTVSCGVTNPMLRGDPGKLGQVLTNLIVNAVDAYKGVKGRSREIGVAITEHQACLEIRVSDQGCGIAPEQRERIFEEFFSTKAWGEGTGLGLSIARDIISNFFGGTISVESELGRGSTFILRFPPSSPETKGHSVSPEPPHDGPDEHLL